MFIERIKLLQIINNQQRLNNIQMIKDKEKDKDKEDELTWYILIDNQPRGPLSIRDLDVLLRTNQITSRMYGCNTSSKEWRPLSEIEQLKQYLNESSKQIVEIGKKIIQNKQLITQQKQESKQKPDETQQFLNTAVQGLVTSQIFKDQNGKWNVYDQEKQVWLVQAEEPTQKILALKSTLLEQLKSELFKADGWQHDKKQSHMKQVVENLTKQQQQKKQKNKKKTKRNAEKKKQKWYNAKINTFIYLTGLPEDTTEEQIKDFVSKAGVLRIDPQTQKQKIKMYKTQDGLFKGDAIISYAKQQSVDLAIDMLNQREFKPGHIVKIQKAHFNQKKEQYIPRQSKKQTKVDKVIAFKNIDKQFDWREEEEDLGFKIVILKNMFTLQDVQNDLVFQQTQQDIKQEIQKIGPIVRIKFFDTHPDGIVEVKFKEQSDAAKCISLMNGRFFDGREVECFYWDGETNYKLSRQATQVEGQRIEEFGKWLEGDVIQEAPEEEEGDEGDATEIKLTLEDLENM